MIHIVVYKKMEINRLIEEKCLLDSIISYKSVLFVLKLLSVLYYFLAQKKNFFINLKILIYD